MLPDNAKMTFVDKGSQGTRIQSRKYKICTEASWQVAKYRLDPHVVCLAIQNLDIPHLIFGILLMFADMTAMLMF